jgi:peptidoglycan/LPS O-acetylase OafA/YrhL
MMLPYTAEVFFAAMARYNAQHAVPVAMLAGLSLGALALAVRGTRAPWQDRAVGGVLTAGALMSGWAHQWGLMAELNFMAAVYAPVWIVQAALLAGALTVRPQLGFTGPRRPARIGGLAIAGLGALGHPLALVASGVAPASLPLAGSAPDATAILTAGLLAAGRGPRRLRIALLLVPLAWGGVAAVSAYLLTAALDYTVAAAALAAAILVLADRRTA